MRQKTKNTKESAKFSELLPYIFSQKKILFLAIFLGIVSSLASLIQPVLVQQIIVQVEQNINANKLVIAIFVLLFISALSGSYEHYLLQKMGENIVLNSRKNLIAKILKLPIYEFDHRRTGDLVSRMSSDTTILRAVLTRGLVESIGGAVTFIGAIAAMIIIDSVLFLATFFVVFCSLITVIILGYRIRKYSKIAQEKVGDLSSSVERALSGIRTIRATNASKFENKIIDSKSVEAWNSGIAVAKVSAVIMPIATVAIQLSFLAVLGVGGYRVANGETTIANLVAFIFFLFMMIMPLGQFFGAFTSVNLALGALGRIQEIIALPSENDSDVVQHNIDYSTGKNNYNAPAIELINVSFKYPQNNGEMLSNKKLVLDNISFNAKAAQRTAIVGPSGSGKSTILNLIERFYELTDGSIRINNDDIKDLSRYELRSRIGYVEQDAPILAGTLRENITLGARNSTDKQCLEVLENVNLSHLATRSKDGLDALVGERGIMLSGGERQRLAIARALIMQPDILLLDESTSSLDSHNEKLMRDSINIAAKDRTVIVVAHRLATVVDADNIIVLSDGKIVGEGTHEELISSTPLYKDLAAHQLLI